MITGWWFGTLFLFFYNIWDNPSHWLICFRGVETTNQSYITPVLWSQHDPCTSQYFRTVFPIMIPVFSISNMTNHNSSLNDCSSIKWYRYLSIIHLLTTAQAVQSLQSQRAKASGSSDRPAWKQCGAWKWRQGDFRSVGLVVTWWWWDVTPKMLVLWHVKKENNRW